jgi:hypothetical protein
VHKTKENLEPMNMVKGFVSSTVSNFPSSIGTIFNLAVPFNQKVFHKKRQLSLFFFIYISILFLVLRRIFFCIRNNRGSRSQVFGFEFDLPCFIDSPTMLLAVKLATILFISLPACGELGSKIKLELVSAQ